MKKPILFSAVATAIMLASCSAEQATVPGLIPQPVEITASAGQFRLAPDATISWSGSPEAAGVAEQLALALRPATGYEMAFAEGVDGDISLATDTSHEWKPEEYRLTVEKKKVTLTAGTAEGLFRGIQTLR